MAVAVAIAGMNPMDYLKTTDEVERMLMEQIAIRHRDVSDRIGQNRAVQIANAVGKAFGG